MFSITGFSRLKLLYISVIQILLCTAAVTSIHLTWPIKVGDFFSIAVLLVVYGTGGLCLLLYLNRKLNQHTKIVRSLFDSINEVIVVKDYEGNYVFSNRAIANIYGTDPENMVGKDDYYFTKDKQQSDFLRDNARSIMDRFQKEEVYQSTTDTVNGEVRYFQSIKVPFYDAKNQLKILIVAKDMTEITKLKEQSDKDRTRLEYVLEASEEGLWEWDIKNDEISLNDRARSITGIKGNSFEGFKECIFPEDKERVLHALNMLIEHDQLYSMEYRIQCDGKIIWAWDRGRVAEYDNEGKPVLLAGIIQDITVEKQNQKKIEYLAYYDQLTGFINRTRLESELRMILDLSQQKQCFSALLFLDLDRFKILNDSYGHHMGDKLLKAVVERFNKINKKQEIVSRFGSDEFVIILPLLDREESTALQMAREYANSVVQEIASEVFTLESDVQSIKIDYSITVSIGGIIFNSNELSDDKALQLADSALQRIKASGGNAAIIYDLKMQHELKNASELQKTIHSAIANHEFCIYLQPKYDLNKQIVGAEALIRWHHPKFGVLFPGAFIEMAEENNMILPIGDSVLEQACEQLEKWQASPNTKHLEISMNLSAKQIWQSHFVEHFINIVESYNIDHTKLIAEITESVLIQDLNDAIEKLTKLKDYGVSISLDDFGTGYSSLNYLRLLPIDEIKIDRSFINDITQDRQARIMVKSIIELATNFEMRVISEGVEDKEQLELLKSLGVPSFQGFYFSKPLPVDDIDKLLYKH